MAKPNQSTKSTPAAPAATPAPAAPAPAAIQTAMIAPAATPATPAVKKPGRPPGYRSAFRVKVADLPPAFDSTTIPGGEVQKTPTEYAAEIGAVAAAGGDVFAVKRSKSLPGMTVKEWREKDADQVVLFPRASVHVFLDSLKDSMIKQLEEKDLGDE